MDSTHTKSRFNLKSQREILVDSCKDLRKSVYLTEKSYKDKMPAKLISGHYEDQIEYTRKLVALIHSDEPIANHPAVKEALNYVEEVIEDNQEHLAQSKDQDVWDTRLQTLPSSAIRRISH